MFFLIPSSHAQYDKELYKWESHLPVQIGREITQSPEHIYYSTRHSIGRIEKEEQVGRFYSKVEGLSETGISEIAYDNGQNQLIIAYNSGNLDFLQEDNTIINIADFKLNPTFPDKTINKIIVNNNRILYATRFGVVAQNSSNYLFDFTTNMELEVLEMAQNENTIYAATEEGIYKFVEDGIKNPGDFTTWDFLDGDVGLPALYSCTDIEIYKGKVYAIIDNSIYENDGNNWNQILDTEENFEYRAISSEGNHLLIGMQSNSFNTKIKLIDETGEISTSTKACGNSMRDVIESSNGDIWYSDNWHGVRVQEGLDGNCDNIRFNSPYSFKAREIRVKDGNQYVASGGINENFLFDNNKDGFFTEIDGDWSNYNGNTTPIIKDSTMLNFVVVQPHPTQNKIYAGAFPGGLLEIDLDNKQQTVYNSTNSPIQGSEGVEDIERVIDIKFDEEENLWVSNYNTEKALHVLTVDKVWHSFQFGNFVNIAAFEFDDFGNIWMQLGGSNGGVLVFDYGGTIADPTDDDWVVFNNSNSAMKSNRVLSLKKDLDGDMWIGTQNGPVIFECGNIFPNKDCFGSTRKVLEDSIPAPLLDTEAITSIAIDGANRKWLGSGTGIYVQSPSGNTQLFRYTVDNSPLFDNSIIDLEYDPILGEMYIATAKGVQSIRIDATGASEFFSSTNMYAFPNPVRPNWDGPIAIQGLAEDANVKITDIQGRLVFETVSNGGLAVWNGTDYNGRKADSGVYIVYATYTKDLSNVRTETTKLLIVR